jgi:hypothetical protein
MQLKLHNPLISPQLLPRGFTHHPCKIYANNSFFSKVQTVMPDAVMHTSTLPKKAQALLLEPLLNSIKLGSYCDGLTNNTCLLGIDATIKQQNKWRDR